MNSNVGTIDRIARLVLGVGAVAWAASMGWSSTAAIILLVAAAVLAITGAVGFCPLYRLLGISTSRPAATSSRDADVAARH